MESGRQRYWTSHSLSECKKFGAVTWAGVCSAVHRIMHVQDGLITVDQALFTPLAVHKHAEIWPQAEPGPHSCRERRGELVIAM